MWGQDAGHQHLATQVQPWDCAAPAQRMRLWRLQYHVGVISALVGVGELIELFRTGLGPGLGASGGVVRLDGWKGHVQV